MRKGSVDLKTIGMLLAIVLVCVFGIGAAVADKPTGDSMVGGADLIIIDSMKALGPLERPPVAFFHSRHTEALAKISRDCSVCHLADDKGRLSPKFKRLSDTDRQAVNDTYHINCIACHRELTDKKLKSGPQTCGGCHQEITTATSR